MPELPEVETLCRDLRRTLVGREFRGVDVRLPKLFRPAAGLDAARLVGTRVLGIERRGKFLVIALTADLTLICHLRLSGQLVQRDAGVTVAAGGHPVPAFDAPLPHKATHTIFTLDAGGVLYHTDIRQFGFILLLPAADATAYLAAQPLGPDALGPDLTVEALATNLRRSRVTPLKALLLNQSLVSGLGNIYADESLFLAGLHPLRRAPSLAATDYARLHAAIRAVLTQATEQGVAHVLQGRAAAGTSFPRVHGREGLPCPTCQTPIVRIRVTGRSTYFCPRCQPEGA